MWPSYSRAAGLWHTWNASFAVSLVTVVTGGQLKKLITILFLTKFPYKTDFQQNKKERNWIGHYLSDLYIWRPTLVTSLPPSMAYFYTLAPGFPTKGIEWLSSFFAFYVQLRRSSICSPLIRESLYFNLFTATVYSNKSWKLIRFWHIFCALTISKYFCSSFACNAASMLWNLRVSQGDACPLVPYGNLQLFPCSSKVN